jgi:2-hydroxychromene-2-carboxylate isomerase
VHLKRNFEQPWHAQLFPKPDQHDLESLVIAARDIGLDPKACRAALVEQTFAKRVREIAVASIRSGIVGTPTLFINGKRYEDRLEEELLRSAISSELGD